ncbi:hypothetical protein H0H93_010765 [Arthromyces matolae]|nr:hypothetical protein H0H93_010765 [Arthromyces matolae]
MIKLSLVVLALLFRPSIAAPAVSSAATSGIVTTPVVVSSSAAASSSIVTSAATLTSVIASSVARPSSTGSAAEPSATVPFISLNPNEALWNESTPGDLAGVNMRLEPGAVRELHWHSTSEWAYVLKGHTQVTAVDTQGRNFISTVGPGDLWFFPPGIPHSLQATGDDPDGSEFLLVFDDGEFSEDDTFLVRSYLIAVVDALIVL